MSKVNLWAIITTHDPIITRYHTIQGSKTGCGLTFSPEWVHGLPSPYPTRIDFYICDACTRQSLAPFPQVPAEEVVWVREVEVLPLVIQDLTDRVDRVGKETYGKPLMAFRKKTGLKDAYEEALDLSNYLRQAMIEHEAIRNLLKRFVEYGCIDLDNKCEYCEHPFQDDPGLPDSKHEPECVWKQSLDLIKTWGPKPFQP